MMTVHVQLEYIVGDRNGGEESACMTIIQVGDYGGLDLGCGNIGGKK
jgi:hypothetical protein